jgi:DNA-binding MarR family transcriptional regulator
MNTALDFCLSLTRASAALGRRFDGRLGAYHGISFADLAILLQLSRAPDGRLRRVDLADQVGLTASAVTRALLPLEKIGLVSRKPDPHDARVGYATLTAAGRRLLEDAIESAESIAEEIAPDAGALSGCAEILDGIARPELASAPRRRVTR